MRKIMKYLHLFVLTISFLVLCANIIMILANVPQPPLSLCNMCFGYVLATLLVKYVYRIKND
jgi:hypothetical protein